MCNARIVGYPFVAENDDASRRDRTMLGLGILGWIIIGGLAFAITAFVLYRWILRMGQRPAGAA